MKDFKALIHDVPDFPKPGVLFRDISPLLLEHFSDTVDAMAGLLDKAEWAEIDALAGIESRGFIFAAALAKALDKGFLMVRKKGKLPRPACHQEYALEYGTAALEIHQGEGQRILLVDDVLATGGTFGAAAELAQRANYDVAGFLALIDLRFLNDFNWHDKPVWSLVQYDD